MKPLFEPTTLANPSSTVVAPLPVKELAVEERSMAGTSLSGPGASGQDIAQRHSAGSYPIELAPSTATAVISTSQPSRVKPPDITDEHISALGSEAAGALTGVSSKLMAQVRSSDAADFGKGLNELVVLAKGLDPSQIKDKGVLGRVRGLFANAKERMVSQYASVERQMDTLTEELAKKAKHHEQRIVDLEDLYTSNYHYHQSLEAAVAKCHTLLANMQQSYAREKAIASNDSFDVQILADYTRLMHRLEKRISDLERAKMLSKQVAPQIRMMQEDARSLVGSFGDVKAITLPAWKNTFSLYILQQEQKQAVQLLNSVSDATDQALRQSADLLRQNSADIATARNRDVVSIETISHINQQLIGAVEDVKRIDTEGTARRKAEATKLLELEAQLLTAFSQAK